MTPGDLAAEVKARRVAEPAVVAAAHNAQEVLLQVRLAQSRLEQLLIRVQASGGGIAVRGPITDALRDLLLAAEAADRALDVAMGALP